jgi:gentisate 1,2-dioxygenase
MQLDTDEGLLNLKDFYDSISADISPPEQLLADAVLAVDSDSDANSFFSCVELEEQASQASMSPSQMEFAEFRKSMQKLSKSMLKSRTTRRSLYAETPRLIGYKRSDTVENVLQRIEDSSHQIDSYYYSLRAM